MKKHYKSMLKLCLAFAIGIASPFIGVAQTPGTLDPTFNFGFGEDWTYRSGQGFTHHGNGQSGLVQPDGKTLIGGQISQVQGYSRINIARFNTDGTLDPSFDAGTAAGYATIITDMEYVTSGTHEGKIYACGSFTSWSGNSRRNVVRLNSNGSIDLTFNTGAASSTETRTECLALQSDGKVLVGGWWSTWVNGSNTQQTVNNLVRLNTDGTRDIDFTTNYNSAISSLGYLGIVMNVVVMPNDKILVGTTTKLFRLNSDGTMDNSFTILTLNGGGYNMPICVLSNGRIAVGGNFTSINANVPMSRMVLLEANGAVVSNWVNPNIGDRPTSIVETSNNQILFCAYNFVRSLTQTGVNTSGFTSFTVIHDNPFITRLLLQPDGNFVATGNFYKAGTKGVSDICKFNGNTGEIDGVYNRTIGSNLDLQNAVRLSDGKYLVSGNAATINGSNVGGIARINSDGSLDPTFNASGSGMNINACRDFEVLPDGKIVIIGGFTSYNGTARPRIARLNADGTLDASFSPVSTDGTVFSVGVQSDGKVIIGGGWFHNVGGQARGGIARLNANGTLDNTFNPSGTYLGHNDNIYVNDIYVYSDNKILVSGRFTSYNGTTRPMICRLNADGTLDASFNAGSVNFEVLKALPQADGKILVGGSFTTFGGQTRNRVVRLNADGSLDGTFAVGTGCDATVRTFSIDGDGKIYIGGYFTSYNGTNRARMIRVNSNGTIDNTFNTVANIQGGVNCAVAQPDGQVFIVGEFYGVGNLVLQTMARLQGAACITPSKPTITGATSFCSGGSVILTASGASGHVWSTGATTKTITVNSAGTYSVTRINGACTSEVSNDFVVSVNPTPSQPTVSGNRSFCAGTSTVLTSSSATGNIWSNGATTQSITVTAAGTYSVSAIENGCTSAVSEPIVVTVTALPSTPEIESNSGTSICLGSTATLSAGTADGYIWSTGATTPTIAVSNPGNYSVSVIVNGCTSAVSSAIVITNQICSQVFTGTGNLSNAAMWSSGNAPVAGTDVVVRGQLTAASSISLRNVSVDAGHSIILPAGVTLTITGNLSNEGTISGDGTLRIAGSNNQSFGGGTISNLLVDNGATAVLSSATAVSNTLTIGNNTTFNMNNAGLTMLSTAMRTARLAAVPAGASITNSSNFTVQRYLNPSNVRGAANGRGNYYLTGPVVQGKTVGLWNSVSPYGPETFNQTTQNGSRFYFFNNPASSWRKPTSLSQSLPAGTGVQVWFGSSAFFSGGRTTWSVSGMPVVGNFNLPLGTGTGFHLVSNPYPSTIDWDSDQWTKTNLAGAIYIYDWVNLRYRTYSGGIGTNGGSRYLTTAQGFFVNATSANPALTAREGIKVTNQVAMQRSSTVLGLLRFEITDASGLDEMVIANRAAAVAGFDADDAEKFLNPMTNIYAVGTPNQAIASMNLDNVSSIPFVILNRNAGTVTLRTSQFNNLEGYTFNLFDEQTGELLPYSPDAVYTFTVGANQAYRLQLRVGSVTGIENFKANVFEVFPNPTTGKVTLTTTADAENVSVVNAVGQVVYTAKAQAQMEMNLNHLAKGVYMVQVQSAKGVSSQRLVIK